MNLPKLFDVYKNAVMNLSNKELVERIGASMLEIRIERYERAKEKAYLYYEDNGIEALCEYVSIRQDSIYPHKLKEAILEDVNSPLSESDKVFLATYSISKS